MPRTSPTSATRRRWIAEVELRIATGVGAAPTEMMKAVSHRTMDEIFRHGAAALGVSADICERQFIEVDEEAFSNRTTRKSPAIRKALGKTISQLGSVGGGNHFHGTFHSGLMWGQCGLHQYDHGKHAGEQRGVSIVQIGTCPDFKEDPSKLSWLALGAHMEFLPGRSPQELPASQGKKQKRKACSPLPRSHPAS